MKRAFQIFLLLAGGFAPLVAMADEATRNTQIQLKNRGFYYGTIDGKGGPETEAALRRFQIRQGLQVTGTLNEETAQKLTRPPSASAPAPPATYREEDRDFLDSAATRNRPAPTPAPAQTPQRRYDSPGYTDRDAEPEDRYASPAPRGYDDYGRERYAVPPPVDLAPSRASYDDVFRGTVFENASRELQEDIVRDAQARLARLRYYDGALDGLPGPRTENALADFQEDGGRRVTGQLDMPTLADLGLISQRRSQNRTLRFGFESAGPGGARIYRGIQIER